jgi:thymidylate synthase
MKQYLDLLQDILDNGIIKQDRTGTGTLSVFGRQMRFDLRQGLPLVTTKKLHIPSIIHELLWFISGATNIRYLRENGVRIWDEWADAEGELGDVYGKQWRAWPTAEAETIDQLSRLIEQLKQNPDSRRHIISAWNVASVEKMALPPCHYVYQFYVADGKLSCLFNMRSVDCFLGLPFNIASYALLTHMLAQQCNLHVGDLIWTGGDVHLYLNHLDQTRIQLSRKPFSLAKLTLKRKPDSLFDYKFDDFIINDYQYHPLIKASVAV